MGVVDHAEHLRARVADELHASGHAAGGEARGDRGVIDAEQLGTGDGHEGVVDVEQAREANGDGELPGIPDLAVRGVAVPRGAVRHKREGGTLGYHVGCPDVGEDHVAAAALDGLGASRGDADELGRFALLAPAVRGIEYALEVLRAQVHHGAPALREDLELRGEVVLEGGVLDGRDVVLANVEEGRDVELDAQGAVVLEGLARYLHDHGGELGVAGIGEMAPQVGRLGRGVGRLDVLDAVVGVDGADDAAGALARGGVDDRAQHVGGGGLALGAREAHLGDVEVGPAKRRGRDERHGEAHVARDDRRGVRGRGGELGGVGRLADVGDGAGLECRGEIGGLERAALAEEDVAGRDAARVASRAGDGGVCRGVDARDEHAVLLEQRAQAGQGGGSAGHGWTPHLDETRGQPLRLILAGTKGPPLSHCFC